MNTNEGQQILRALHNGSVPAYEGAKHIMCGHEEERDAILEDLNYIKSIMYQGDEIKEGRDEDAGLFLFAPTDGEPDYKINSISTYASHTIIIAEKVRNDG